MQLSSILGLVEIGRGRIAVYGDSNCLDSSHMVTNCYWLLRKILDFTNKNVKDPVLFADSVKTKEPLHEDGRELPSRRTDVNFSSYSAVVGKDLICHHDSRFEVWRTKGYVQLIGRNRKLPGYPTIDPGTDLNITMMGSNLRSDEVTMQIDGGKSSGAIGRNKFHNSVDFLGLLNRDEV